MNADAAPFEILPVWKDVGDDVREEVIAFWSQQQAIRDPARAQARAPHAVCVARGDGGAIVGVGTAVLRVLPRLRQPLYHYRQFLAPEHRDDGRAVAFARRCREVLEAYNTGLDAPEALGVVVELPARPPSDGFGLAYDPESDSTFIGYSPRGTQLRVSYFRDAVLQAPLRPRVRRAA